MIIIGIDPGKAGGIAVWNPHSDTMTTHSFGKMTESDVCEVFTVRCLDDLQAFAYIEKVHSSPQMGVKSAFTFGQGYGFLRGALLASLIPFDEVRPQQWMKEFGMKKSKTESQTEWKNRLKGKAQQLFPDLDITLATADAVLICEYGRRQRAQS